MKSPELCNKALSNSSARLTFDEEEVINYLYFLLEIYHYMIYQV